MVPMFFTIRMVFVRMMFIRVMFFGVMLLGMVFSLFGNWRRRRRGMASFVAL